MLAFALRYIISIHAVVASVYNGGKQSMDKLQSQTVRTLPVPELSISSHKFQLCHKAVINALSLGMYVEKQKPQQQKRDA